MDTLKKIGQWIVYSSANADRYSLTIKSLVKFLPTALIVFALFGFEPEQGAIIAILESIATAVTALGAAVFALQAVYGAIRKAMKTVGGTNAVLNR